MQTTVKLTQEDIKIIILDFYKRQGDIKESVHFYETVGSKDDSEIYAIVSEKEKNLTIEKELLWTSDLKESDNFCTKCRRSVFGYSGPNLNNPG